MEYGFVKNNVCTNIAIFSSEKDVQAFKEATKGLQHYDYDDIVRLSEDFSIGSLYQDGKWISPDVPKSDIELDEIAVLQLAMVEQFESNLSLQEEMANMQLALCELFEGMVR